MKKIRTSLLIQWLAHHGAMDIRAGRDGDTVRFTLVYVHKSGNRTYTGASLRVVLIEASEFVMRREIQGRG